MILKPQESEEKKKELIKNILAYDSGSETMTTNGAKYLVQRSGIWQQNLCYIK